MERIVFTEKSEDYLNSLASEENHVMKKLETSAQKQETIKKKLNLKITSVLSQTTPLDEYQQKIIELATISGNAQAVQSFLSPKILHNDLPPYMRKKIDHITKIITNTKDGISKSENNQNTTNLSVKINKPNSPKDGNSQVLQRKCNALLYSESYLERLVQRYNNYIDKNQDIKMQLNKFSSSQKRIHFDKKISDESNESFEKQKTELLGIQTKYKLRFRSRLGDYHKKKYISVWGKNKLPPIGFRDNIDIARQKRLDNKAKNQIEKK